MKKINKVVITVKGFLSLLLILALMLSGCSGSGTKETTAQTTAASETVRDPTEETATSPTELTEEEKQILAERRDIAEAEMRKMMSMLWRTDTDITYSLEKSGYGIDYDIKNNPDSVITLVAGRLYSGMPYAHGTGSEDGFLSYSTGPDENGIYAISGLTGDSMTGNANSSLNNRARISNDCADAVYWSWSRVSNSISFPYTRKMTEFTGCLKVGEYDCNEELYSDTKDTVAANGELVMFAAYAQLQKADGVVMFNGKDGHAMMISDIYVEYIGNRINGETSYVTVHEQVSSNLKAGNAYYDEQLQELVYKCGEVDKKYTFQALYKKGYLPITCKELIDPSPLEAVEVTDSESSWELSNITAGTFSSNYRISHVTITITDSTGAIVQQAVCYGIEAEMFAFNLNRFDNAYEKGVLQGTLDIYHLTPGTYHCTHVCHVSTGEDVTVRDFDFTLA